MKNNTLNDRTQLEILPALEITEKLIEKAIHKETGYNGYAEITAMTDLGFSNNYMRMKGGFFTGMHFQWESSLPFVPVDATVNSCGVSVFVLNSDISYNEFVERIILAKEEIKNSEYNWNFERGNHFISLCQMDDNRCCVVMHASADEYKKTIIDNSLYPIPGVWYYNRIHHIESDDGNRFLRYLIGTEAERFISIAMSLEEKNHSRMRYMADAIFGNKIVNELLYVPHYGMPTNQSIAIGCSWKKEVAMLLTVPGRDLYLLTPSKQCMDDTWLTPHGLGAIVNSPCIQYNKKELYVNNKIMKSDNDIASLSGKRIRFSEKQNLEYQFHINQILTKCNASIWHKIHPLFSLNKNGFANIIL